eukprot:8166914-Alexandrium_andersonii.AAC.1
MCIRDRKTFRPPERADPARGRGAVDHQDDAPDLGWETDTTGTRGDAPPDDRVSNPYGLYGFGPNPGPEGWVPPAYRPGPRTYGSGSQRRPWPTQPTRGFTPYNPNRRGRADDPNDYP